MKPTFDQLLSFLLELDLAPCEDLLTIDEAAEMLTYGYVLD